jgi:endonuclease III
MANFGWSPEEEKFFDFNSTNSPEGISEEEYSLYQYKLIVCRILYFSSTYNKTFAAMQKLTNYGLTPEKMMKTSTKKLEELLENVSFQDKKAKFIKNASKIIKNKYGGVIPDNVKELLKISGISETTASLMQKYVFKNVTGIPVGKHVLHVANKLGWIKTRGRQKAEQQLESWLPKSKWKNINSLLREFGKST